MHYLNKGILNVQGDIRVFKRFNKIGNGNDWNTSLQLQDAIIFEATKNVYIYGIGIYGPGDGKKHEFKVKYKYVIQKTPNGETIYDSYWFEESSTTPEPSKMIQNKYFKYLFQSVP